MERVEAILGDLGLKPGDAVNMLFAQIERRGALPFDVSLVSSGLMNSQERAESWMETFGAY